MQITAWFSGFIASFPANYRVSSSRGRETWHVSPTSFLQKLRKARRSLHRNHSDRRHADCGGHRQARRSAQSAPILSVRRHCWRLRRLCEVLPALLLARRSLAVPGVHSALCPSRFLGFTRSAGNRDSRNRRIRAEDHGRRSFLAVTELFVGPTSRRPASGSLLMRWR